MFEGKLDQSEYTLSIEIFDLLEKGPLQELCNVIFCTVKGSFKLNQGDMQKQSKQPAIKIWSMVNEWEALLIPQKIPNSYCPYHIPSNWPKGYCTNFT